MKAKAGETITPSINSNFTTWMHSYVYLDINNDGRFSYELDVEKNIPEGSDLMSFSYYNQRNSKGDLVVSNNSLQPPVFTIPTTLKSGYYRLRYKVDWNSLDPAGNMAGDNSIKTNGGVIVDTRLNVHGDKVRVSRGQNAEGTNGEMENADGSAFLSQEVPFGEPFTFVAKPSPRFVLSHVVIRHGYNLDGDSLVNGTPQYEDVVIPASRFQNGIYTIPAEFMDGDVRIMPYFLEK